MNCYVCEFENEDYTCKLNRCPYKEDPEGQNKNHRCYNCVWSKWTGIGYTCLWQNCIDGKR